MKHQNVREMKHQIIILTILILMLPFALADTNLYVNVNTSEDINAVTVENTQGNVDNTIICNAGVCTTNVHGPVTIPDGQQFNYNQYTTNYVSGGGRGGSGFSFQDIEGELGSVAKDYYNGTKNYRDNDDAWNLWSLFDAMFVSHKEYQPTLNNLNYLAKKVDRLEARMNAMERILGLENDTAYQKMVDDEEVRIYANRTKDYSCFDDKNCVVVGYTP